MKSAVVNFKRVVGSSASTGGGRAQKHSWLPRAAAAAAAATVKLSLDVERKLDDGVHSHKRHDGRLVLNRVALPERFRWATAELMARTPNAQSSASKPLVLSLARYLAARKPPTEDHVLRRLAANMESELLAQRLNQSPQAKLVSRDKGVILEKLRSQTYHWEPIDYTSGSAITYLCARAAPDYAVLTQIFNELRARAPEFLPKALLDFGSGIGTAVWAANGIWENVIQEYFAVDTSSDMNDIARQLMQDGRDDRPPFVKGTFFRQFLPASHTLRYDLVVSAFSLMELPNRATRLLTLDNLWNKTQEFLVIVETGSKVGFQLVMEARSHLLHHAAAADDPDSIDVFAPCSHKLKCPRLTEQSIPCNFEVGYEPLFPTPTSRRYGKMLDRFSYVVLRKRRSPPMNNTAVQGEDQSSKTENWPRIVSQVLVRPRLVVCRTCDPDGQLREAVITAAKHGRDLYRCARACRWGDRLPAVTVLPKQENAAQSK